jgi:hypothetical protein
MDGSIYLFPLLTIAYLNNRSVCRDRPVVQSAYADIGNCRWARIDASAGWYRIIAREMVEAL